jgi:HD-GYP domain-containing protein (c-di-GMP phosphodiesterase class II)
MTPEETTLFQTHPLVGAQILREIKRINPAVIQAVAEHHERRNRTGFPSRISASQLSPVGEIVGLSDEFLMLLGRTKDKPGLNIIKELELKIFPGFSRSIIDIFRSVFLVQ